MHGRRLRDFNSVGRALCVAVSMAAMLSIFSVALVGRDRVHSAYQIDISNVNGSLVSYIARLPVGSSGQLRLLFFVDGVYRSLHVLRHAGRTVALNAPIARLHAVLRLHPRCRTLFDR